MDFKDLVYLDAIDRHRSLTRAAKELYITQPALSNFLRNLEDGLNVELFRRNGNTLEPTVAGNHYLEFARRTMAEKEALDRRISLFAYGKGQIRVGIPFSRSHLFADTLIAFSQQYPDTEILLEEDSYYQLDEKLKSCQLDLIFTNNPEPNPANCVVPISEDEFQIYVAPQFAPKSSSCSFSSYPWVDVTQFRDCRFLLPPETQLTGKVSRAMFRDCDYAPRRIFPVRGISTMLRLARSGYGICLYGHTVGRLGALPPEEQKNLYAFGEHAYTSQFSAVYLSQMKYPQRVQDFIRLAQEYT